MILTASAVQDNYGILAAFGVGLDFACGAGVFISSHVAGNQVTAQCGHTALQKGCAMIHTLC